VTALEPGNLLAGILLAALALTTIWILRLDIRRSGQRPEIYFGFRVLWLVCKLWHGVRPRGPDPLPPSGPAIVIANHTSAMDPFFLQCATQRLISFLMAREYYSIRWLKPLYHLSEPILVNRTGRDTAATRATLRALGEGRVVGIFPEGGIHLDPNSLGEAKPGTALMALLSRAPVIPAYVDRRLHTNRILPAVLRPANARVFFGPPIDLGAYYERHHDAALLQEVTRLFMKSIEQLYLAKSRSEW
jgi:1-acyl-sn-glycerol-3-phosphate acyltransferase